MMRGPTVAVVILLSLVALAIPVTAHAPEFTQGGENLQEAKVIEDPTKSWAIYSHLNGGSEPQYYLLRMKQGDNITVSLTAPRCSTDQGFLPSMVLMGPGIEDDGTPPPFVHVPEDTGAKVITGALPPKTEYEPFSPSAFCELGALSMEAPLDGDYYLAVYDESIAGNYGLAVGLRESFTAEEWLLVPFSALSIYQWEGQSLAVVLAPPTFAFLIGLIAVIAVPRSRPQPVDILWVMATAAGLLMFASGVSLIYQMSWSLAQTGAEAALVVTLMIAIPSLILGYFALRIAYRGRSLNGVGARTRIALLVIGAAGLLLWSGWIAGPVIAIIAALLPGPQLLRRLGRSGPTDKVR